MLLWRGIRRNASADAAWRRKLEHHHASLTGAELNYPKAGITQAEHPPAGFHQLLYRERIGNGEADFVRTTGALRDGRMHTGAGLDIFPDPVELDAGAELGAVNERGGETETHEDATNATEVQPAAVTSRVPGTVFVTALTIGPIASVAPCRVVAAENDVLQVSIAYGTLTGHPLRGEESFTIALEDGGTVWLTIRALSRAANWWQWPATPLIRRLQLLMAARFSKALKLAKEATAGE